MGYPTEFARLIILTVRHSFLDKDNASCAVGEDGLDKDNASCAVGEDGMEDVQLWLASVIN